jgi:hypothetical protein
MQLDDPFPVERLPRRVQGSIPDEFQGRYPTAPEVARVPDAHWLTLPGMGARTLAQLRLLTVEVCEQLQPSALTKLTVSQLLKRHNRLIARQEQLQTKLREIRNQVRASKAELWMREMTAQTE